VAVWLKLDTHTVDDPRLVKVSPAARWLWICGRCYIAEHLTDGVIHRRAMWRTAGLSRPGDAAAALVEANLWQPWEDDYFDPTWHDAIRSRAQVEAERRAIAERVAKHRAAS
jgi:hypothetical protein